MAIIEKAQLKGKFLTGDVPTQGDYHQFIDAAYAWREGWSFLAPSQLIGPPTSYSSIMSISSDFIAHVPVPINARRLERMRFSGRAVPTGTNPTMAVWLIIILHAEASISSLASTTTIAFDDPLYSHAYGNVLVLDRFSTHGAFDLYETLNFPLNSTAYEFLSVLMWPVSGTVELFPIGYEFY